MSKSVRLNIQGLARRDSALMSCMVADEGRTFVSIDLSSGEPTVTSEYSKDANYYAACFGMVGKQPYYKDGLLMIDDIYLMAASMSPLAKDQIKQCFDEGIFNDWLVSESKKEYVQKKHPIIGPIRNFHKPLVLGLGYSMGPRKMVTTARDQGYDLSYKDAKAFFKAYWETIFGTLGKYSKKQQWVLEKHGCIINQFGYRLVPDSPHKAFNYTIQSTVSGIINLLDGLFTTECVAGKLDVSFITIIHDELIYSIKDGDLENARKAMDNAVLKLNNILDWSVNVRTGWAPGKTMYEAK